MPDDSQELISGGHLVAKALKAEGVDVIFTLCGGHIIDIYDGCVDEGIKVIDVRHEQVAAHAADGYARITGKPGCAVVTAGPGTTDAVTGVANAFRAECPMLLIGGQGALSQHKMGSLQDLPHVDMMTPITKFAATVPDTARVADMVVDGVPRVLQRRARARPSWRSRATCSTPRSPAEKARVPEAGHVPRLDQIVGDPAAIERLADLLAQAEKPAILLGSQVWTLPRHRRGDRVRRTLNVPAYMNGAAAAPSPPGDPHHFQLSRRYAFDNADLISSSARRSTSVWATASALARRDRGPDRPRLPHGRQEPRHRPRHRRRRRRVLAAVTQAASGPQRQRRAPARKAWLEELRGRGDGRSRSGCRGCSSDASPDPPATGSPRDQRVPHRGLDLHRRRRRHRHLLRPGRAAQVARPLDGPGPLGTLGVGIAVRDGRQARTAGQGGRRALRRRRVLADRLGLRDAGPLQPAVRRRSSATTPR